MLPEETLKLIQDTAQQAQAATILPALNVDGRKAFVQQGSEIKEFTLPPPVRNHTVNELSDLIAYALRVDNPHPVVWHGQTVVTLLPDDTDRRDAVVFPLTASGRFKCLAGLEMKPVALTQQQFVRLLRRDLGMAAVIVQQFRKLDWKDGSNGSSEVSPTNLRVGKSIVAEVQGVSELPEELTVPTPVYLNTGERDEYNVQCFIEIDPQNQAFGFGPLPDELAKIIDLHQANICNRLRAALGDIPIYHGTP